MLIAIDIGATKTLVASFNDEPTPLEKSRPGATEASAKGGGRSLTGPKPVSQKKFPTDKDFDAWLAQTQDTIDELRQSEALDQIVVGSRGRIDSKAGTVTDRTTLGWIEAPVGKSLGQKFDTTAYVHNDATMAALGEANFGAGRKYETVLYITISTGVGTGIIHKGEAIEPFTKSEGGMMVVGQTALTENSRAARLEKLVSGDAVKKRYGKYGYEIKDDSTWEAYAGGLALGLNNMIVLIQPNVVVLGGGMSVHFDKFYPYLKKQLLYTTNPYPIPPIVQAKYVETSVIYGCYAWHKQTSSNK